MALIRHFNRQDTQWSTVEGFDPAHLETEITRTIGQRVRDERARLGVSLHEVARRAGLSAAMVSKIENAQTSASLRTLARLSGALEVPVTALFRGLEEERDASYVRAGQGNELVRLGTRHGHRYELLAAAKGTHRRIQPFLVTLTRESETFPLFQHEGVEFLYGLEGQVDYRYGRDTYELRAGDSLMFDGRVSHGPETLRDLPIRFLSITIELSGDADR
jgi:transcriptional regulator with XRE-family HTH domain